jgi:hypothetical protein
VINPKRLLKISYQNKVKTVPLYAMKELVGEKI